MKMNYLGLDTEGLSATGSCVFTCHIFRAVHSRWHQVSGVGEVYAALFSPWRGASVTLRDKRQLLSQPWICFESSRYVTLIVGRVGSLWNGTKPIYVQSCQKSWRNTDEVFRRKIFSHHKVMSIPWVISLKSLISHVSGKEPIENVIGLTLTFKVSQSDLSSTGGATWQQVEDSYVAPCEPWCSVILN